METKLTFAASSTTYKATLTSSADLLYVSATSTDTASIKVEKTENGVTTELTVVTHYTLSDDLGLINSNAIDATHAGNLADGTTGKDNIYVKDLSGNVIASVVLDYSNVAPAAKSVSWKFNAGKVDADDTVTGAFTTPDFAGGVFSLDTTVYQLQVLDQYGLTIADPSLTINGVAEAGGGEAVGAWINGGATNTIVIKKGDVTKTVKVIDNTP